MKPREKNKNAIIFRRKEKKYFSILYNMIKKSKIILGEGIVPEKIVENQITSLRFNVCDRCHLA